MELVKQTLVELALGDQVLNHELDAVHLLGLRHVKPDFEGSLKLLNSELQHLLLN